MIKTTTIAITSILAVLMIYLFPKQTISPGDLSGGHRNLENDCMKCHTMFFGTPGEKCVVCHKLAEIGILTTTGVKIEKKAGQVKAAFHHLLSMDSCLSCHPDHKGRDIGKVDRQFSHDLLQKINIKQCTLCHKGPTDTMHEKNKRECSQCHTTEQWRPAAFDHTGYFRFDRRHGPDCLACHHDNNYRDYTCYGCHEHSPGKVQEEHLEEGIRNYQDCATCHRSSNEDEAKGVLRSGRYQDRSWSGIERKEYNRQKGYWKSGYNEHEGDEDDRHEDDDDDYDDDDDDHHHRHGRHDDD